MICAVQEERFSRKKHDARFPSSAIDYCLDRGGPIDYAVFYDKPYRKFDRLLKTHLALAPRGLGSFNLAMPAWLSEKLFQKRFLGREIEKRLPSFDAQSQLLFAEHHQSHAASAFFPSPFESAAVLTMDGVGEWATTSLAIGDGADLSITKELHFPHSLGLLYAAFTYYTGFKVNSGEYKLMGLAPYGEPKYANLILDHLIDVKEDGTFRLNQRFFDYSVGKRMTNERFNKLFGGPRRQPEDLLTQREMDLAASVQVVTEEVLLRLTRSISKQTKQRNLCLAGGVALNCVANGKIHRDGRFDRIWVQPAAGDAGGAVGAALSAYHSHLGQQRSISTVGDSMCGSYLGPDYSDDEIRRRLSAVGARFETCSHEQMIGRAADGLSEGLTVGWFQGRMEFGPRALGNRSIIGDPRSASMQRDLNLKVKYRESFRPFAPAVLREKVSEWFDFDDDSPYMLFVAGIAEKHRRQMTKQEQKLFGIEKLNVARSDIPAVTHVDYSARIQTVEARTNPCFHELISAFYDRTGCPIVVNTSFNVRGEPIVCTPEDAFRCFMGTEIELLAVGDTLIYKDKQDPALKQNYSESFDLD